MKHANIAVADLFNLAIESETKLLQLLEGGEVHDVGNISTRLSLNKSLRINKFAF